MIDFGVEGSPYLVMDFVTGRTLREVMQAGPLPAARAFKIAQQLLAGLAHAHAQGIVHRDLKPENLILSGEAGLEEHLRILDFGLAKLRDGPAMTAGMAVGTPSYMSPEQSGAAGAIDARTDLYAVGVLLFEILAGRKPFLSENVGELIFMHRESPPPLLREAAPEAGYSAALEAADRQGAGQAPRGPVPVGGRVRGGAGGDARRAGRARGAAAQAGPRPAGIRQDDGRHRLGRPATAGGRRARRSAARRARPAAHGVDDSGRARARGHGGALHRAGTRTQGRQCGPRREAWRRRRRASPPAPAASRAASTPARARPPRPRARRRQRESPHIEQARQLVAAGQTPKALEVLEQLRAEKPADADAPYMLATIYFDQHRWSEALAAAQTAVRLNPALKTDGDLIRGAIRSLANDRGYEQSQAFLRGLGAAGDPVHQGGGPSRPEPEGAPARRGAAGRGRRPDLGRQSASELEQPLQAVTRWGSRRGAGPAGTREK